MDPYANCNPRVPRAECTLDTCCLAQSSFLYRPNFSGNVFFTIFFALLIVPHVGIGIRYKTWGYSTGMVLGLALETVGYYARVGLHKDPFSNNDFLIYLIGLTIAPVFVTAAIYLCLSRIIVLYGQTLSFFRPRTLAIAFMSSDLLSLILQAAGGGMAETAHTLNEDTTPGVNIMIAGLLLQALSLGFFLLVWAYFMFRAWRGLPDQSPSKVIVRQRPLFYAFSAGLLLATLAILVRSIYRVAELWGGFSGDLWNNETDFLVLDGAMLAFAVILLTAFHPGPAFDGQWQVANWSFRGKGTVKSRQSHMAESTEKELELWRYQQMD